MRTFLGSCFISIILTGLCTGAAEVEAPVDIGSRLELFVDDWLIDSMSNLELKLHSPRSMEKVLTLDRPWEGVTSEYVTVFKDDDRYRMYFRGSNHVGYTIPSMLKPSEKEVPVHVRTTSYAESSDGLSWSRPSLGIFEFNGSKDNSIVWMGKESCCFAPFKDANPSAPPEERYKAVSASTRDDKPVLMGFVSADAVHWKKIREEPIITDGKFDSLNVAFWDTVREHYVAIYRDFRYGARSIKYASSEDFVNWTPGQWGEFGDAPLDHLYTNATTPYFRAPHIYLAFPRRYIPWKTKLEKSPFKGACDTVFMSSRDGVRWDRRFMEAFIRPGRDPRNWMHRTNLASWGVVPTSSDEISLYVVRNRDFPSVYVERSVLRLDGFVSVHAGYSGGELLTRPLVFDGDSLVLNFATSAAGSIQLEIQDAQGNPLPGFALEASPLIWGDEVEHTVRWDRTHSRKTSEEMFRRIRGMPVRLRFVMKDADLYSLRFK